MNMNENKYKMTLCWDCEKAVGLCPWSAELKPVEGWTATPTRKKLRKDLEFESFIVYDCPEFKRDAICNGLRRYDEDGEIKLRSKAH